MHPGLPGVLCHSIKLRALSQDTSLRDRVETSCWTSLAWWRRLHQQWEYVIFRSEVGSHHASARARCPRQTIAAGLPAFGYLKRVGKQQFWLAASGRDSSPHRYEGHVSSGIWREVGYSAWIRWCPGNVAVHQSCLFSSLSILLVNSFCMFLIMESITPSSFLSSFRSGWSMGYLPKLGELSGGKLSGDELSGGELSCNPPQWRPGIETTLPPSYGSIRY
jgi:hypothetical protein